MTHLQEQPGPGPGAAAAYYEPPGAPGPARDLTACAVAAFAAAALATLCACASALVIGRAARVRAEQGLDAVDWSLAVHYSATALGALSLVFAWVGAALWLHRARRNAEALAPASPHALGAGWAWGGWVTPVVSLWFPYVLVRDVRRASTPHAPSGLLACWWALLLLAATGAWGSFNLRGSALVAFEHAEPARRLSVLTAAVAIAALAAWGQVLWAVTAEQHERMHTAR